MKLSKEELLKKVNEVVTDEEVAIALMEDISDSMEIQDNSELETLQAEMEETVAKLEELKQKYKERFLTTEIPEENEDEEELQEEEIIDVKEI